MDDVVSMNPCVCVYIYIYIYMSAHEDEQKHVEQKHIHHHHQQKKNYNNKRFNSEFVIQMTELVWSDAAMVHENNRLIDEESFQDPQFTPSSPTDNNS